MGWSIGWDTRWNRDIGYGVPATCDHPGCGAEIDRGLGYVCGDEPFGGEHGCGLFFCGKHTEWTGRRGTDRRVTHPQLCERCAKRSKRGPFTPTPDHPTWIRHKLKDPSWKQWRDENPEGVALLKKALSGKGK